MSIIIFIICFLFSIFSVASPIETVDINKGIIPEGYYKVERYYKPKEFLANNQRYCKYYYKKDDCKKFKNLKTFKIVEKKDVKKIKNIFGEYPPDLLLQPEKYDFKKKYVDEGDYYYFRRTPTSKFFEGYDIYLFDTDTYILYYLHIDYPL